MIITSSLLTPVRSRGDDSIWDFNHSYNSNPEGSTRQIKESD
jgi:hypothetical protein